MSHVPALDRSIALVEHLAARHPQRLTLSELCRDLDLPKATAHSLLAGLCTHGWLWREEHTKAYGLGPALGALAERIAAPTRRLADRAMPEMERLAASTGARVVASEMAGGEIVMLAVAGEERPFGTALRTGQRLPLAPPIGTVFLAWAGDDAVERWLARHGPRATAADLRRWRESLVAVRRRGYCVALDSTARHLLGEAVSSGSAPTALVTDLDHGEYVLLDVDPDREYAVSVVAAPVFDEHGAVAMALTLFDLPDRLPAVRVVELADALVLATSAITKELRHD